MSQLTDFIKSQLDQKVSWKDIKSQLLSVGWSLGDIDNAFQSLNYYNDQAIPRPSGQVPLTSFPNEEIEKLHPNCRWLFVLYGIFSFARVIFILFLAFTAFFIADFQKYFSYLLLLFVVVLIFSIIFSVLQYNNYSYGFNDIGLRISRGIISKNIMTIPYERIQSVDIERDLAHRILGLSSLSIQTAGMGIGRLIGLSPVNAENIQKDLIQRSRQLRVNRNY